MRILAVDPGVNLGWAWGDDGVVAKSGTYKLPPADESGAMGMRFAALNRFLMTICKECLIEKLYFEEPFIDRPSPGREPPPRSFRSEAMRWGTPAIISMVAAQNGIDSVPIMNNQWRSALGVPTMAPKQVQGNEARRAWVKNATRDRIAKLGYSPKSQDEIDALGIFLGVSLKQKKAADQPDLFAGVKV